MIICVNAPFLKERSKQLLIDIRQSGSRFESTLNERSCVIYWIHLCVSLFLSFSLPSMLYRLEKKAVQAALGPPCFCGGVDAETPFSQQGQSTKKSGYGVAVRSV